MDERLAAYAGGQWDGLVDLASQLCADTDDGEAQELVLSTLTRIAVRWRLVPAKDNLDGYVREALARACDEWSKRRRQEPADVQLMQVGFADVRAEVSAEDPAGSAADVKARLDAAEALAIVGRRAGRARNRRLLAAAAAVVVVAAVAVTAAGSGGGVHRAHRPASPQRNLVVFPRQASDFAGGVTAGGGYIWTIESHATKPGSRSFVARRDPVSGRAIDRYSVPQQDDHIAFGFGKVWVWHDNTDYPKSAIATIDEAGNVTTETTRPPIAIESATFTNSAAWFTEPNVNKVITLPHGVLGLASESRIAGARFVVPLSATSVLVAGRSDTLRELPGNQQFQPAGDPPTLLAAAPSYGIWIAHDAALTYQPSIISPPTVMLTLPFPVAGVIGDPGHGVYVSSRSVDPLNKEPYLVYYSPAALSATDPQPTARLDGLARAEDMVAGPAGGVVFVTNEGAVAAWRPTGFLGHGSEGRDRLAHAGITSSTRRKTPQGGFA